MKVEDARIPPQHGAEARHAIRLGDDVVAKARQNHMRLALQMGDETGDVSDLSSWRSRRSRRSGRHPLAAGSVAQTHEKSRWIRS